MDGEGDAAVPPNMPSEVEVIEKLNGMLRGFSEEDLNSITERKLVVTLNEFFHSDVGTYRAAIKAAIIHFLGLEEEPPVLSQDPLLGSKRRREEEPPTAAAASKRASSAASPPAAAAGAGAGGAGDADALKARIVEHLQSLGGAAVGADAIAKAMKCDKKAANSALYKLLSAKLVCKSADTKPLWSAAGAAAASAAPAPAAAAAPPATAAPAAAVPAATAPAAGPFSAGPAAALAAGAAAASAVDLGGRRRATVSVFGGRARVDIREYYEKDGELAPGKKGISLSAEEWRVLEEHMGPIQEAVAKRRPA